MVEKKELATRHLATINCSWVAKFHTWIAGGAFAIALLTTMSLHFQESVSNEYFAYPKEWFPSIASVTSERYPEKSFFQLFIAIVSGPRFVLVGLWYLLTRSPDRSQHVSKLPMWYFVLGLVRTCAGGGFTYITSTDDHEFHDSCVISYGILSAGWMAATTFLTMNSNERAFQLRKRILIAFAFTFIPLGHYFIQHRLYQKQGAMSKYALCEWAMVILDLAFDSVSKFEFESLEIEIAGPSVTRFAPAKSSHQLV